MIDVPARIRRSLKTLRRYIDSGSQDIDKAALLAPQLFVEPGTNRIVDFAHRAGPFYGMDGEQFARQQVELFLAVSDGYHPPSTILLPEDALTHKHGQLLDQAAGSNLMLSPPPWDMPGRHYALPATYAPRLLVFGLGVAAHVPLLIEKMDIGLLVLCETDPFALAAALASQDWEALLARARERGIPVRLIFHPDGAHCTLAAFRLLRAAGLAGIVGIRAYVHHEVGEMSRALALYQRYGTILADYAGYFSDELRQTLQTRANLPGARVLSQPGKLLPAGCCAVVVGSGPSLDRSLELLHAIRDRVFLFSCGTAIKPLLKAGFLPDVQVELETHYETISVLRDIADPRVYEQVPLLCPSGIPPEAARLFRNRYFFARQHSCSSLLFGSSTTTVSGAYARVGNAGAALATFLGFHQVLLLGMDCGYIDDGGEHATGTFHETEEAKAMEERTFAGATHLAPTIQRALRDLRQQAIHRVKGITDKEVLADPIFFTSIGTFCDLMRAHPDRAFLQVGHGAHLEGAQNMTPEQFTRSPPSLDRTEAVADLLSRVESSDLESVYRANMARTSEIITRLVGRIRQVYAQPTNRLIDFVRQDDAIVKLLRQQGDTGPGGASVGLLRGSLMMFTRTIVERALMIKDEESRQAFLRHGAHAASELAAEMAATVEREYLQSTMSA